MPYSGYLAIFGRSKWPLAFAALFLAVTQLSPAQAQTPRFEVLPIGALKICAAIDDSGKGSLTARSANNCLSSSCRRFIRSTLKVELKSGHISLSGDLMHRNPVVPTMCTRDCGGARTVPVPVEGLKPGRYTVVHNGTEYGSIDLVRGGKPACVGGN